MGLDEVVMSDAVEVGAEGVMHLRTKADTGGGVVDVQEAMIQSGAG